jgi:hypothetical protein
MKRNSWFLACLGLALLATIARGEAPKSLEDMRWGITKNLHDNYQACNEENMQKLLACMSREMPNRDLFVQTVRDEWAVGDTYNRLEHVEVLEHSDAPHANCSYPYATAWVTQTVIQMQDADAKQTSVFRQQCKNGRCNVEDLAHKMGVTTKTETTKLQMLFKHEQGQWKLIAGLTEPVPAGKAVEQQAEAEEQPVEPEAQAADVRFGAPGPRPTMKAMKSVFN